MVNITVDANCGNSPKKLFLKNFNIAFVEGNADFISEGISDDIVWEIVGEKNIQGKAAFMEELVKMGHTETLALIISNIITHGKEAAVNGTIILQSGEKHSFCDVYSFTGAKGSSIKSMTSYVIKTG